MKYLIALLLLLAVPTSAQKYPPPGGGSGTVTSVATGTGLSGGPITTTGTVNLANTAVTPGAYTSANITVDAQGRLTAAASGGGAGANTALSNLITTAVNETLNMATGKTVHLSNDTYITARNSINTTDYNLIHLSTSDEIQVGDGTRPVTDYGTNVLMYATTGSVTMFSLGNHFDIFGSSGNTTALRFFAGNYADTFELKVPTVITSYAVTMPAAQGTGALTNDGAGNLSFTPAANVTLSNLENTVAVNKNFKPSGDDTIDFGGASFRWSKMYFHYIYDETDNPVITNEAGILTIYPHIETAGTDPAVSACGTAPNGSVVGDDTNGRITVGGGGVATSCTLTFASAYTNAAICTVGDESTSLLLKGSATTTVLTITAATPFGASDKLVYHCEGYQ